MYRTQTVQTNHNSTLEWIYVSNTLTFYIWKSANPFSRLRVDVWHHLQFKCKTRLIALRSPNACASSAWSDMSTGFNAQTFLYPSTNVGTCNIDIYPSSVTLQAIMTGRCFLSEIMRDGHNIPTRPLNCSCDVAVRNECPRLHTPLLYYRLTSFPGGSLSSHEKLLLACETSPSSF